MNLSILKEVKVVISNNNNNNNNNDDDNNNNNEEDDLYQTSVYEAGCLNEIRISNLIKTEFFSEEEECAVVPFYFVVEHEFIMLKDLNLNIVSTPIKYVLLRYNLNISNYQPLSDYLATVEYPSRFLSTMLDIYSQLLNSLLELEKMNICFFRVSADNILIDQNSNTVVLSDFKNSLQDSKEASVQDSKEASVQDSKETSVQDSKEASVQDSKEASVQDSDDTDGDFVRILENTTCYTYKPIEIHVVHYLLKVNGAPLSYSSIDEISTYFVEKMEFLNHFDQEYKAKYYHKCVQHLKTKYLNKPKDHIINEIRRETLKTWDNFALSILFLHIFENMIQIFSLNNTIINEIVLILKQNLDPVPNQRHSLFYTMNAIGKLLLKSQDWSFLRLIPKSKMKKLYERIVN
jgi:hypothetical protein